MLPVRMSRTPWTGIEIRHLITLVTVANAGSFRGAGEELGYAQSAVSAQIAQLEGRVGLPLVDRRRGTKKVGLTSAGRRLAEHVSEIVAHLHAAKADLVAAADPEAARLRVGVVRPVVRWLMPPIMTRLAAERPALPVTVLDAPTSGQLLDSIARGTLDLAIAQRPCEPGPFHSRDLAADKHVLVRAARAGAAPIDHADLEALARLPLIVSTPAGDPDGIEALLAAHRLRARIPLRVDSHVKAQSLACAGFGVAVLPLPVVDERDPRIEVIALPAALQPQRIALVWHRERHYLQRTERFCTIAAEAVANLERTVTCAAMPSAA